MKQQPATRVIGLCRGMPLVGSGCEQRYELTPASKKRVEAITAHYHKHKKLFKDRLGKIVFSGGYAGTSSGQEKPPEGMSEANSSADLAIQWGVPSSLIEVEGDSPDTIRNFKGCVELGFFADEEFTPENPLGIAASKSHFRRAKRPAAYAFGLRRWDALQLIRAEHEALGAYGREWLGTLATRMAFAEIDPQDRYAPGLEAVAERFEELTSPPYIEFAVQLPWHVVWGTFFSSR